MRPLGQEGALHGIVRVATSIRVGITNASKMIERRGKYSHANGLALALCEVGRIERTLHTLDG
ncbi:MAG: transposase [Rhodospirillales bacterium]|nr:transposase [Rhodospirillales bacterium]